MWVRVEQSSTAVFKAPLSLILSLCVFCVSCICRGFGFVTFDNEVSAANVLAKPAHFLDDKKASFHRVCVIMYMSFTD